MCEGGGVVWGGGLGVLDVLGVFVTYLQRYATPFCPSAFCPNREYALVPLVLKI